MWWKLRGWGEVGGSEIGWGGVGWSRVRGWSTDPPLEDGCDALPTPLQQGDGLLVCLADLAVDAEQNLTKVGSVWHGMAWHGMAWHGMVSYGMAWCGVVWYGMVR